MDYGNNTVANVNGTNKEKERAFIDAAKSGNAEAVRSWITAGANVNATNNDGNTALMYAAKSGNTESVRTLIDAGVDVNATNNEGNTALMNAVLSGYKEVVRTLIDAGANVNARNYEGRTALMYAVEFFNKYALRDLIDAGADVNAADKHSRTALFYTPNLTDIFSKDAASIEITRILLDTDINVNVKDILGKTALFYQVEKGNTQTCRLLIEDGKALVNVTDKGGQTPLFFALHSHNRYFSMSGNRFDTAQLLLSNGAIVKETRSLLIFWIEFYLQQQLQNNLYSMFDFVIGNGFERETVVNSILDVFVCRPMLTLMTETNSVWSDPSVLQEFGGNLSIPIDQHTWTYLLTTAKEYTSNAQRKADIENIIEAIEMPKSYSVISFDN